ncbi:hypothetical protein BKA69DRAFT_113283 [Paraphysoderma sedebokerense]|nr:hypothetical protein BKA69DRAFT_113283 [Paraphysoderma sedebokerense]
MFYISVCRLFYLSRWIQDQGILPMATGRGKTAIVNLHDCGIATANILASSMEEHKNQMYTFTGPELMTGMKLVEHANRVLHSDIEFRDISIEEFKKMMKEIGEVSDAQIDFAAECCMLMRDNKWAIKTDHLMRCLEGRKPTDIETFFRNNADSFRPRGGMIRRLAFKDAL